MPEIARLYIAALRAGHDTLVARIERLGPDDLFAQSGAAEWPVHGVLSHLGSGAETARLTLESQLEPAGVDAGPPDVPAVWDRWNALGPEERAKEFVEANGALVALYESLSEDQQRDLRIDLGFMPEPVDIASLAAMRLGEQTLHGWDVMVAFEPDVALMAEAVPHLLDRSGTLIGWIGKAGMLEQRPAAIAVRTTEPERTFGLYVDDAVSLGDTPDEADATLELPAESWLRLVAGRLGSGRTPAGVTAEGAVSLDDVRRVFPGY
jgi:uncharacterized protein (TIGR03083 family)